MKVQDLKEYKFYLIWAACVIGVTLLSLWVRWYLHYTGERILLYVLFLLGVGVLMAHRQYLSNREMEEMKKHREAMEENDRRQIQRLQGVVEMSQKNFKLMDLQRESNLRATAAALRGVARQTGILADMQAADRAEDALRDFVAEHSNDNPQVFIS